MRVTNSMLHRIALNDVTAARQRLARTQEQASSGLRINRPSDDPAGAAQVVVLQTDQSGLDQFERVVSGLRGRVGAVDNALASTGDLLIRLRELAIQGANDTQDAASRKLIATEVASIHGALVSEANARFGGAHVFSGFASSTTPFVAAGTFDPNTATFPTVSFAGDPNEVQAEIDHGVRATVTLNGQRAFMGDANGDSVVDAGREDVFAVASELWRALVTNDPNAVRATLGRIDTASQQISSERTAVAAVDAQLDRAAQSLAKRNVDAQARLSDLRDADLAQVVSNMVQEEAALKAGLDAMSRLVQPTLLDFLR